MPSYKNSRPALVVEFLESRSLGRSYGVSTYKVTSQKFLDAAALAHLFHAGVVGIGQTFKVVEAPTLPAGVDSCPYVDEVGNPVINKYSGKPYEDLQRPYWVARVETYCDSGD